MLALAPLGARRILTGDDAAGEAFAASGLEAGVAGELRAAGGDAPPEPLAPMTRSKLGSAAHDQTPRWPGENPGRA